MLWFASIVDEEGKASQMFVTLGDQSEIGAGVTKNHLLCRAPVCFECVMRSDVQKYLISTGSQIGLVRPIECIILIVPK